MPDLRDILSENEEPLNEDELMNYLDNNLSEKDKQAFEQRMEDSTFVNDALEGLRKFKNKQQLQETVSQLNKLLEKQTSSKTKRNDKRTFKELPLILLTALIILAICIIGYFVIHLYSKHSEPKPVQPEVEQPTTSHTSGRYKKS